MTRSFFVPLQAPSLNKLQVSYDGRGRWRIVNLKRAWAVWIPPLLQRQRAKGPVRLTVTRFYRGRGCKAYDLDNFVGGLKPIIDLLKAKAAGYIVDDNPRMLELVPRQQHAVIGEAVGTLFEFEEIAAVGCKPAAPFVSHLGSC
jgi:hypothetical protein